MENLNLSDNKYVLVTLHRVENVDKKENLSNILDALVEISKELCIIFPVHPRTLKNLKSFNLFERYAKHIKFIKPTSYTDFLKLLSEASCGVTDSGGIQKEALILKTPCVTVRTTTEWTETTNLNANVLVGTDKVRIVEEVLKRSSEEFNKFVERIENPYGDGKTGNRILNIIKNVRNLRI